MFPEPGPLLLLLVCAGVVALAVMIVAAAVAVAVVVVALVPELRCLSCREFHTSFLRSAWTAVALDCVSGRVV